MRRGDRGVPWPWILLGGCGCVVLLPLIAILLMAVIPALMPKSTRDRWEREAKQSEAREQAEKRARAQIVYTGTADDFARRYHADPQQ